MKTFSTSPGSSENRTLIDCPVCSSSDFTGHFSHPTVQFVRCTRCGMVMQNPQPTQDELLKRYGKDYFHYEENNEENFFNLMKLGLKDIGFDSIEKDIPQERTFLDIGCATGMLLEHMRDSRGWDVRGVEVCEESVEKARRIRRLDVFHGTLDQAGFPDDSFDVVHSSHVIEHVADPVLFLREIRRILKPGGFNIITTPNVAGFQARWQKGEWRSAIADHVFLFSKKTLPLLLAESGLKILRKKTWGGIAQGLTGPGIKKIMDRWSKRLGFGDVMIYLTVK